MCEYDYSEGIVYYNEYIDNIKCKILFYYFCVCEECFFCLVLVIYMVVGIVNYYGNELLMKEKYEIVDKCFDFLELFFFFIVFFSYKCLIEFVGMMFFFKFLIVIDEI